MRKVILLIALSILFIYTFSSVAATEEGKNACVKDESKIEEGRKCRKSCKEQDECRGANKGCYCDGACGMTCFNPDSDCSDPTDFENGFVEGNSYVVGSTITYSCAEGFVLSGEATRVCHADRKWGGKVPVCELGCSIPPRDNTAFHTLLGNGFPVGTKTKYECRFGYELSGNADIECMDDYKWSIPNFDCNKLSCGAPTTPANGYIEGNDFSFGAWITYHCEKGYVIDDPRKARRYCSSTGTWSAEARTCSKIQCPEPTDPENGYVTFDDDKYEFRSIINYYCDAGFELVGSAKGECNEDGNWGAVPTCTVDVNCNFDGLSSPLCGYTNEGLGSWERQFIQERTLSGNPTYVLRAAKRPAVLLSPALLTETSYCFKFHYYIRQITDNKSFVVKNGQDVIGKIYSKEKRHRWLNQQITVNPDIFFNSVQFSITLKGENTKIDLDDFSLATNECANNCEKGTCLSGGTCIDRVGTYTCLCTRYFTGDNCEKEMLCPPVPEIPHGTARITPDPKNLRVDTRVRYSCNKGYIHVGGPKVIFCTEKGTWSIKKNPICEEILCSTVKKPLEGSMEIESVDGDDSKMSIGTIIRFKCPADRYLKGSSSTIVCRNSGQWSDERSGSCEQKKLSFTECPEKFRKRGSTCYREYRSVSIYADAQSKCAYDDATLSVIRSEEKRTRFSNLISRSISYYVGLDDIGRKEIKWANGVKFQRIEGEDYSGNFEAREDVTREPRCGSFVNYIQRSEISATSCKIRRRYICETLPMSVTPVRVASESDDLKDSTGIYRPLRGVIYAGSFVYRKQSTPISYLYRWNSALKAGWEGWVIGEFDLQSATPTPRKDFAKIFTNESLPQFANGQWTKGSAFEMMEGLDVKIKLGAYDQWEPWSDWSPCTQTCGGGNSFRTRNCNEPEGTQGYGDCRGKYLETKKCGQKQCIITRWGKWKPWTRCSKPCGVGEQTRTRECIKDPESSEDCMGSSEDRRKCNEQNCISSTSQWIRRDKMEHKIVDQVNSHFIAKEDCTNLGGNLVEVKSIALLKFLLKHISHIHCDSDAAYNDWNLWAVYTDLTNAVRDKNENGFRSFDKKKNSPAVDQKCYTVKHSCDEQGLVWSERDCQNFEGTGYICQREWKPCNHNPCNTGECMNRGGEEYECKCSDKYEGENCETALRCNIEDLSSNYNILYASTMEQVNETFVWKDVEIHMDCKQDGQATTDNKNFKCIGLDTWNVKRKPIIDCGNTCILPDMGEEITATLDGEVVAPGTEFAPGVLLQFECPELMRIVGEPLAACDQNGWDVKLPEECEFTFPCRRVSEPDKGKLEIVPNFQKDRLKTGTKVTLVCDEGYVLIGTEKITCDKEGHWSDTLGECKDKIGCELNVDEFRPEVSAFSLQTGTFQKNTFFTVDQSLYLRCSPENGRSTIRRIKCIANRQWSFEIAEYCRF